ncbi:uncharacterized protein PAC_09183 [Phialocephala subalpina]|uniref:Uncharacterized protein n=1 Tax=Phialocephala subalpina TaxID=576137 RepID=A0A1L7X2P1_9HELO|nr:uncharacterized protein PAC_09183 [Phialocephala subalpina]
MSTTTTSRSSSVSTTQSHTRRYSKTGIGGAGNYHRTCHMLPSTPSPSIKPRTIGTFSTSIGGAGNHRSLQDRSVISSEKRAEREEARMRAAAKNWHVGIGGAGNRTCVAEGRRGSNADKLWPGILGLGRRNSVLSEDSEAEGLNLKD